MDKELFGPRFHPVSGGKPKQLVIFLHGIGSNGDDLIQIAPLWAQELPDAEFLSPNAPFSFDMAPYGYQWFSLKNPDPHEIVEGAETARPILEDYIEKALKERGLTYKDLALVGFSQGTMMALHVGLSLPQPVRCILGYSGAVLAEKGELGAANKPNVMMVHGSDDELVPASALEEGAEILKSAGIPVETHLCQGVGHSISDEGLSLGIRFLRTNFYPN